MFFHSALFLGGNKGMDVAINSNHFHTCQTLRLYTVKDPLWAESVTTIVFSFLVSDYWNTLFRPRFKNVSPKRWNVDSYQFCIHCLDQQVWKIQLKESRLCCYLMKYPPTDLFESQKLTRPWSADFDDRPQDFPTWRWWKIKVATFSHSIGFFSRQALLCRFCWPVVSASVDIFPEERWEFVLNW